MSARAWRPARPSRSGSWPPGWSGVGSVTSGAAIAGTGVAFLAVGLLAGQLMRTSRGANGLAAALIGGAYALRAAGDAGGTPSADGLSLTSAWPSWLSPIGWGQQTTPFTSAQPAPLLLDLALAAVLFAVVVALQSSRDIGSSVVAERPGRARASRALGGSLGLAWRLQRSAIVGWALAGLAFGVLAGTLGETVVELVESNSQIGAALAGVAGGRATIIDQFTAAIFGMIGVIAAAAATQAMIRMRQEEANGSAELLLALPLRRTRWILDYLVVGAAASVFVLAAAVGGAIGGLARSAGTADRVASVVASAVAQLPAALLILAIAALLFAVVPRFGIGLSWGCCSLRCSSVSSANSSACPTGCATCRRSPTRPLSGPPRSTGAEPGGCSASPCSSPPWPPQRSAAATWPCEAGRVSTGSTSDRLDHRRARPPRRAVSAGPTAGGTEALPVGTAPARNRVGS